MRSVEEREEEQVGGHRKRLPKYDINTTISEYLEVFETPIEPLTRVSKHKIKKSKKSKKSKKHAKKNNRKKDKKHLTKRKQ